MSSLNDARKLTRPMRRRLHIKKNRDLLFQVADFDPWIEVDGVVVCYFCRHPGPHAESCLFVEISGVAKRSGAFPFL